MKLSTNWSDSGTRRRSSNRIHSSGDINDDDLAEKTVLIPGEVVDRAIDAQVESKLYNAQFIEIMINRI